MVNHPSISRESRCDGHPREQSRAFTDVTVVVTAYGQQSTLERALLSITGQSGFAGDILVVDDASPVPIRLPALKHERLQLVRLARNVGVVGARNFALAFTRTEFVLFLDGDDELMPEALMMLRTALYQSPAAVFAFGHTSLVFDDGTSRRLRSFEVTGSRRIAEYCHNFISLSVLMRRQAILDIGGFDPFLNRLALEDWDLWLSLFDRRLSCAHVDRDIIRYHLRHSGRNAGCAFGFIRRRIARLYILFKHRRGVPLSSALGAWLALTLKKHSTGSVSPYVE